jgi:nucleotide-binding universal stress UspA family protein
MIRRILVPLDGSRRAEGILPHLVCLASVFGARLDLLHVISSGRSPGAFPPTDPFANRLARAQALRYLDGKAESIRAEGLEVWTKVEEGGPAAVIVDLLRRGEYDLVGLTPHGNGDDRLLRIGCTAVAVILNARSGILLVPDAPNGAGGSEGRALYGRILAPVDCSPRSDWSLGVAAAIARGTGSRLKVVHILDRPEIVNRLPTAGRTGPVVDRLREDNRMAARRYLDEVAWRLEGPDLPIEATVVESGGGPAEAVLQLARSERVDLVVLSAHGRGATSAWPLGGTASKLLFWAQFPILILQDLPTERSRPERVSRSVRAVASDR